MNNSLDSIENLHISGIRDRSLLESACAGILIFTAETRKITDVNPFLLNFFGYPSEYFLGKELREIRSVYLK